MKLLVLLVLILVSQSYGFRFPSHFWMEARPLRQNIYPTEPPIIIESTIFEELKEMVKDPTLKEDIAFVIMMLRVEELKKEIREKIRKSKFILIQKFEF